LAYLYSGLKLNLMRCKIGLGGGCHWCTEAIFKSLRGVSEVAQGWIAASEAPFYSEAVLLTFSEEIISMATLIEVHLHTHSCTANHHLRSKYRSAIYVFSKSQKEDTEALLKQFQKDFDAPIITRAYHFMSFKPNTENFIDYYYRNPERPFCKNIIEPKLRELMKRFGHVADPARIKLESG
jgi:peptide-methionine (S)-S-oxide reductase